MTFTGKKAQVLAVALACVVATPGSAAAADDPEGSWAWSVPSCSASKRLGYERSIYARSGKYYGWAEVRLGTSGRCQGYAWVRLHVTVPIHTIDGMTVANSRPRFEHPDYFSPGDLNYVRTGTHNGKLTRSGGRRLNAWIDNGVAKVYSGGSGRYTQSRLVFGHLEGGRVQEYQLG